jgi:uncharacterized membrane protein YkvA (DUF1232 family)
MRLRRFFDTLRTSLPRVLPLMRDSRVPGWLKLGTVLAGLLIISPIDVFGDIPGLGILDDAVLLALLTNAFVAIALRMTMRPVRADVEPEAGMKRARPVKPPAYRLKA